MRRLLLLLLVALHSVVHADDSLVFIAHAGLPKADQTVLQRLYTGRVVNIGGQAAVPVSYPAGHSLREKFLTLVMGQSEEQYTGYWLVRRYVGKGAPPMELSDVDSVVNYVVATPGAVGYVPLSKVPAGGNVIFRR